MASTILNSERIKLGLTAVQLLQAKNVTSQSFRDQMWQFIHADQLDHLIKETFEHSLEQNTPGLCYWQSIKPGILWVDHPIKKFYQMPDDLLEIYREGTIHNGIWCDNISRVRPDLLTSTVISQICACGRDAAKIREIVNPLKDISQNESDPIEYQTLAWKAE